jgi:hypothetical protein
MLMREQGELKKKIGAYPTPTTPTGKKIFYRKALKRPIVGIWLYSNSFRGANIG